ncbi:MAG TPA: serine/threonine-protein kinase [Kofleriaceae bacterium]|jgi:serine/threonine-protein kinase
MVTTPRTAATPSSRPPPDQGIAIGQVLLGKYRVEAILGHGGMGVVAQCIHLALNERVAIKMLRPDVLSDADAVERFMREAQAVVKLKSEYVAKVSDYGQLESGVPYMVMEYLEGQDLGSVLDEQGTISQRWAVEIAIQTCEALAEAHALGIVHRDIKPTNLFVTWRPDGSAIVKVLDFGISKVVQTDMELTQTQSLLGTPAYMSPEQMRSARLVDARTDIWSLGTVLFELLEGHRPFEAESFSEMCVKVATDAPLAMQKVPPALAAVVMRCLAKAPEQRFGSMAEMARELAPFGNDARTASVLVERMQRTLDRSTEWASMSGQFAQVRVPSAQQAVPIAIQTGIQPSAPVTAPIETANDSPKKRRRAALWIAFAALSLLVIGIAVVVGTRGHDEPIAKQTPITPIQPAPGPQPLPAPPPVPVHVVEQPVTPAPDPVTQHTVRPPHHPNPVVPVGAGSAAGSAATVPHAGSAADCDIYGSQHGC